MKTKMRVSSERAPDSWNKQSCVQAIKKSSLSSELKKEMESFIQRNILPDCGRVPPNCLKAHLINTALSLGYSQRQIERMKNLFKSRIGFEGYYLDAGKLKKVEI